MIHEYDELQAELKQLQKNKETAFQRVAENERRHLQAQDLFHKEQADVVKLEKQSLSTFVQNLLGNYEEKLNKEKQDIIQAKIELDTAAALHYDALEDLEALEGEITDLKIRLTSLREQLKTSDPVYHQRITIKEEQQLALKQEEKEIEEAISAGDNVLRVVDRVLEELDSANSMATMDIFMDNIFVDYMKYNKIDNAEKKLKDLEIALDRYQTELKDVDLQTKVAYEELGEMHRAFDIFFDNIFSDWDTKSTIQRNVRMVEDIMHEVEDVQDILYEREHEVKEQIASLEQ